LRLDTDLEVIHVHLAWGSFEPTSPKLEKAQYLAKTTFHTLYYL
jgi:hypothetical protein